MIVIVDYDTGNTRNVKKHLIIWGVNNQLSADPAIIMAASGLILPGVGAFKEAMKALKSTTTGGCHSSVCCYWQAVVGYLFRDAVAI